MFPVSDQDIAMQHFDLRQHHKICLLHSKLDLILQNTDSVRLLLLLLKTSFRLGSLSGAGMSFGVLPVSELYA